MRIDSEFFATKYLQIIDKLSHVRSDKLSKITTWITQGPNPSFVDYKNIPCLTGRNICDGRVTYEDADYVSDNEYNNYKRFQIHPNDTLITLKGKGSIGKIGFVTSNKTAIFSRNIGVVRPIKDVIDPAYLNAYILSYYGHNMVLRGETGGTGQSTLTCSYIKSLDVPRFNIETEIGAIIRKSEKVLQDAKCKFLEAEHFLANILSVDKLCLHTDNTAVKLASQSFKLTDRLDAEYYQPKYDELKQHLMQYNYKTLSEIAYIYRGNLISENLYCENANRPAYIRGADISSNILLQDKCIYLDSSFVPNKEIKCKKNDLVFALIGSVGTVARVTDEFIGSYISNNLGIIRLKENVDVSAEYLHLFLTAKNIGSLFFEQKEMRTAQPKISPKDIEDFIIPIINDDQQYHIIDLVQKSFILRSKSNELLNLAKSSVEIAIEQGEDKALELLNQRIWQ